MQVAIQTIASRVTAMRKSANAKHRKADAIDAQANALLAQNAKPQAPKVPTVEKVQAELSLAPPKGDSGKVVSIKTAKPPRAACNLDRMESASTANSCRRLSSVEISP